MRISDWSSDVCSSDLDPATGKQRWRFDPNVPDAAIPYTAACRSVAYYAVPGAAATKSCARRIIFGTLDARLFALDSRTGRHCQDFGTNGKVATTIGMGEVSQIGRTACRDRV